jgi:hypothetical protein
MTTKRYVPQGIGPTGRTATYVIAASDAPAHVKAQADYAMPNAGADLGVVVNTAYNDSYLSVLLSEGTFNISTPIIPINYTRLEGQGRLTTLKAVSNVDIISKVGTVIYFELVHLNIDGDKATRTGNLYGVNLGDSDYGLFEDILVENCCFRGASISGDYNIINNCWFVSNTEVANGDGLIMVVETIILFLTVWLFKTGKLDLRF